MYANAHTRVGGLDLCRVLHQGANGNGGRVASNTNHHLRAIHTFQVVVQRLAVGVYAGNHEIGSSEQELADRGVREQCWQNGGKAPCREDGGKHLVFVGEVEECRTLVWRDVVHHERGVGHLGLKHLAF